MLSVGGPAGVAHIGAIAAMEEANIRVDCVVGNSMGALVGSLYATAPSDDLDARFKAFVGAYADATRQEALRNGIGLGLVAGGLAAVAKLGGKAATRGRVRGRRGAGRAGDREAGARTDGARARRVPSRPAHRRRPPGPLRDLLSGGDEHRRRRPARRPGPAVGGCRRQRRQPADLLDAGDGRRAGRSIRAAIASRRPRCRTPARRSRTRTCWRST